MNHIVQVSIVDIIGARNRALNRVTRCGPYILLNHLGLQLKILDIPRVHREDEALVLDLRDLVNGGRLTD